MISLESRRKLITWVNEAVLSGARKVKAAGILGFSLRQIQRWEAEPDKRDGRRGSARRVAHALSAEEKDAVLRIANSPEYCNLSPHRIVPLLADNGLYLASERTFYRVLAASNCIGHRQKSRPPQTRKRPELAAFGPGQAWSWDISYLKSTIRGRYYYLYVFLDIFSRKIVGWDVLSAESAEQAARILKESCMKEGINRSELTLHSDNGSPMKGATMLATMQWLGVASSFSRPRTSNDNCYSEALFKTLKYVPEYPERPFETVDAAKLWVSDFVRWYNTEHLHSGVNYVTPEDRHRGKDSEILRLRQEVYEEAKANMPSRWRRGVKKWDYQSVVYLNPTDINAVRL